MSIHGFSGFKSRFFKYHGTIPGESRYKKIKRSFMKFFLYELPKSLMGNLVELFLEDPALRGWFICYSLTKRYYSSDKLQIKFGQFCFILLLVNLIALSLRLIKIIVLAFYFIISSEYPFHSFIHIYRESIFPRSIFFIARRNGLYVFKEKTSSYLKPSSLFST